MPNEHYIEIDMENDRVRLIGINSFPYWFIYKKTSVGGYGREGLLPSELSFEELMRDSTNFPDEDIPDKIPIDELIVGTCLDTGRLVTVPQQNFNPIWGIFGIRRSGKSWTLNRLLDLIYHKWNKKCIVMDDPMKEMDEHCLEWKNQTFIEQLAQIGESSRSLPLVFLHPKTNTLKNIMCKGVVGFEIVLSFKELMLDHENFLKGKESWEMVKSGVYMRNMVFDDFGKIREEGLISCKDIRDIKKLVGQEIPEKLSGVKDKIINVMQDILNSKILDISNDVGPYWEVESVDGSTNNLFPWNACLFSDIIPVIVTSDVRKHFFYPQYMKFIMDSIFKNQTDNELFIKNNSEIFLFFDEVTSVVDSNSPTVANQIFEKIVRESGPARIGVVYATQDVDLVPKFVRKQSTYIFAFNQDAEGANILVNDFAALNSVKKDLKTLKTFECIAFSKINPFHLYDEEGNLEKVMNRPIRMKTFPPLSAHKAPKKMEV